MIKQKEFKKLVKNILKKVFDIEIKTSIFAVLK